MKWLLGGGKVEESQEGTSMEAFKWLVSAVASLSSASLPSGCNITVGHSLYRSGDLD